MICNKCGAENLDRNKFCEKCGESLPMSVMPIESETTIPPIYQKFINNKEPSTIPSAYQNMVQNQEEQAIPPAYQNMVQNQEEQAIPSAYQNIVQNQEEQAIPPVYQNMVQNQEEQAIPPAYQNMAQDNTNVNYQQDFTSSFEQENNVNVENNIKKPKKKFKLLIILISVFVAIGLGVLAMWYFLVFTPSNEFASVVEKGNTTEIITAYESEFVDAFFMIKNSGDEKLISWANEICSQAENFKGTYEEYDALYKEIKKITKVSNEEVSTIANNSLITLNKESQNAQVMKSAKEYYNDENYQMSLSNYRMIPQISIFYDEAQKMCATLEDKIAEQNETIENETLASLPELNSIQNYELAISMIKEVLGDFDSYVLSEKLDELEKQLLDYQIEIEEITREIKYTEMNDALDEIQIELGSLILDLPNEPSLIDLLDGLEIKKEELKNAEVIAQIKYEVNRCLDVCLFDEALEYLDSIETDSEVVSAKIEELKALIEEEKEKFNEDFNQPYYPDFSRSMISSVEASSYLVEPSSTGQYYHKPENTLDNNASTAWCNDIKREGDAIGSWIMYHFDDEYVVHGLRIMNGHNKTQNLYYSNSRAKTIKVTFYNDRETKEYILELRDAFSTNNPFLLDDNFVANGVRIEILDVYNGTMYKDLCISEIDFF